MSSSLVLILSIILSGTSVLLYNISVFQKSKRRIVGMHVGCNICDILMYLVTGGRIGMVNSVVNLCKNAVYAKWENRILTVLFSGLRIFLIMLAQEGSFTMLFIIFEVYITIAMLFGTDSSSGSYTWETRSHGCFMIIHLQTYSSPVLRQHHASAWFPQS